MATDGTGAVVSVVVFDYRSLWSNWSPYNPQTRHSSWSLVLGFRLSIQLETACEAGVSLPFWEGPSTCWYFPRDQTWTMALPPDDQRSQHPRHVNEEICRRYHQCGNYALWWGEPRPKCWQMLILKRSLRKQTKKCFFFLILLCRADIPPKDIVTFHCTCVRSILEYCLPVFHHALPRYLREDIERVQKRALMRVQLWEQPQSLHPLQPGQ